MVSKRLITTIDLIDFPIQGRYRVWKPVFIVLRRPGGNLERSRRCGNRKKIGRGNDEIAQGTDSRLRNTCARLCRRRSGIVSAARFRKTG